MRVLFYGKSFHRLLKPSCRKGSREARENITGSFLIYNEGEIRFIYFAYRFYGSNAQHVRQAPEQQVCPFPEYSMQTSNAGRRIPVLETFRIRAITPIVASNSPCPMHRQWKAYRLRRWCIQTQPHPVVVRRSRAGTNTYWICNILQYAIPTLYWGGLKDCTVDWNSVQ